MPHLHAPDLSDMGLHATAVTVLFIKECSSSLLEKVGKYANPGDGSYLITFEQHSFNDLKEESEELDTIINAAQGSGFTEIMFS